MKISNFSDYLQTFIQKDKENITTIVKDSFIKKNSKYVTFFLIKFGSGM